MENTKILLIVWIAYFFVKTISMTLRLKIEGSEYLLSGKKENRNYIFAFWHDQFFVMPYFYVKVFGKRPVSVLASLSKDGEYISRLMHKFGFTTARGSSSLKGDSALRTLMRELEKGNDVAVTPDGPRGPRHVLQPGAITLASMTGIQIVPVGYKIDRCKILKTWDKFIIPLPFARGTLSAGKPLSVPADLSDIRRDEFLNQLEASINLVSMD